MKKLFCASIVAILTGCAIPPALVQRPEFPVAEYELLPKEGTHIIVGQAFLTTRGGDVKVAAGQPVTLNPVTSYSLHWCKNVPYNASPDPRQNKYLRITTADASGSFSFAGLPAGEYFIVTNVTWEAPGYGGALTPQGGMVSVRIRIPSETGKIIVNKMSCPN